MVEKQNLVEQEDACPVGYFWNGTKCVPNTTPPPEDKEEEDND